MSRRIVKLGVIFVVLLFTMTAFAVITNSNDHNTVMGKKIQKSLNSSHRQVQESLRYNTSRILLYYQTIL